MYAIVQTGGKQYQVAEGDIITVEKLDAEAGSNFSLEDVLAIGGCEKTFIGTPKVEGASVETEVLENGKSKKVVIFKYKPKKDYRKKQGHRQPFTKLKILKISCPEAEV